MRVSGLTNDEYFKYMGRYAMESDIAGNESISWAGGKSAGDVLCYIGRYFSDEQRGAMVARYNETEGSVFTHTELMNIFSAFSNIRKQLGK